MQLGVDFGTTRTIVAYADRGNYPVVTFADADGDPQEFVPTVVALVDDELVYGFEALRAAEAGAVPLRSFKRALASPEVGPHTVVHVGDRQVPLLEVITGFAASLRHELLTSGSARDLLEGPTLSAAIAVPAHAHGAQRFLTLEAFRRAGFEVTAMINEPSAAGLEYSHRQGRTLNSRRTRVVVYDLGGGTFDASLVKVDGTAHEVLDSLGLNDVGGDDIDVVLADCALAEAGLTWDDLDVRAQAELLGDAREAKERLSPQAKRLVIDVAGRPVIVKVAACYAAATPLVERTIAAMGPLLGMLEATDSPDLSDIAGIYLVGGASGLPLVPRLLRERFGRRVHRSPYPAASTAIGLAIAADRDSGYSLTDRLSRGFGVFREGESGRRLSFDPIIGREVVLPGAETADRVVVTRRYRAAHNVGWFRFVEYAALDQWGEPRGDIVPFAHVVFPFSPDLQGRDDLEQVGVQRTEGGPLIEERYTIDPHGMVEVNLTCLDTGYSQTHALRAREPVG
ncbi:molecular chaperone DnaK (HSP70) [Kineosphaera limosa]|uniref:Chaperone protein HscC n=1 Tax=Kineosphaera limosa NBRC 100340 TaxID=1184609 RepID=K6VF67_9MICO|nr:Hsp70 family protein [Kineosphaera limosa]NYD98872.1 molecular chaperone DnaK (HSP70) [Kineosphaera limosa]GAB94803.1 chaperone protein HscC [Kineosphaera limosa NBRC 100340]